jgi:hypothetical protein
MYSLLLKKAIPFALTFIIGSFIGGLFKFFVPGGQTTIRARSYYYGRGDSRSGCDHGRGRYLVAESKSLVITFKPDAVLPPGVKGEEGGFVPVSVTFGADGTVQKVEVSTYYSSNDAIPPQRPIRDAAVKAAQQIRFTPETINGLPVTVTREVEIRFMADCEVMKPNGF